MTKKQLRLITTYIIIAALALPFTAAAFSGPSPVDNAIAHDMNYPGITIDGKPVPGEIVSGSFKVAYMNNKYFHPDTDLVTYIRKNQGKIIDTLVGRELLVREAAREELVLDAKTKNNLLREDYQLFGGREIYLKFLTSFGISQEEYEAVVLHANSAKRYVDLWLSGSRFSTEELKISYEENIADYTAPETRKLDYYRFHFPPGNERSMPSEKEIDGILSSFRACKDAGVLEGMVEDLEKRYGAAVVIRAEKDRKTLPSQNDIISGWARELSPEQTSIFPIQGNMDKKPQIFYHILHLKSLEPEFVTPFATAVDEVRGKLKQNSRGSSVQFKVKQLRRKAQVTITK